MRKQQKSSGFTLIEGLIILAIVGIIVALLVPNLVDAFEKRRIARALESEVTYVQDGATGECFAQMPLAFRPGSSSERTLSLLTPIDCDEAKKTGRPIEVVR